MNNKKILKSPFHDSYDGMLEMMAGDPINTWTYVRDTREGMIESVPTGVQLVQQQNRWGRNFLHKSDERTINMNMLILGLYPHLIFIPIKWKKIKDSTSLCGYHYEYSLTDCSDYFKVKEVFDNVKDRWSKKSRKEIDRILVDDLHIFEDKTDCFYDFRFSHDESTGNHMFFPNKLESAGIEFSNELNSFVTESKKVFKEKDINSPIFITDLSFKYAIVNPRLSGFRVNKGRDREGHWTDVETFSIPMSILDKVIMSIPDRIADFYTSSKEDNIPEPSNTIKIELHGFNTKYSFRPNMKNRPK